MSKKLKRIRSKQFVCTSVRFKFWNGEIVYTVEYCPGLNMWFVFDKDSKDNCLAKFEVEKIQRDITDITQAAYYLNKYFDQIQTNATLSFKPF